MKYWLMKSEPKEYSIDDLMRDRIQFWGDIRNYQVRNMLRDEFGKGDLALFYHSSAGKETGVVGLMEVVGEAYPDPAQFASKNKYYDPKSQKDNPRWLGVEVRFKQKFQRLVSLSELRTEEKLSSMRLLQKGNRLSILAVTPTEFAYICKLGGRAG